MVQLQVMLGPKCSLGSISLGPLAPPQRQLHKTFLNRFGETQLSLPPGPAGVSAPSFLHCFTLASAAFNLQVATPGGKAIDFVDVTESNARWVQDFRLKAYASPAKLESIDGARYHALLIPSCPGALADLASSGSLARILQHFHSESSRAICSQLMGLELPGDLACACTSAPEPEAKPSPEVCSGRWPEPICAIGHGVAALCCATSEDRSWVFHGYSLTGPSVYELVRAPGFARLPLVVEDFVKDSGAGFSASEPDAVHVVLDRHLVTGQNANSTVPAVQNLLFLCSSRK
ncbi:glutamine amidotransferase-like class 1 domain-containing protein 1 [Marmota marmota marmota]|uniref:glutamine amidotransferase-like class 1 domain-containing protein 1 n=1 Tax=Marmota marmota marmota TaxID=9994 RepID=UPI0020922AF7|nr:glutamine amidotransferase-like class 1 domain-containing protein 1 [Marmota marmota marmota]